jgi:hypothetical protein
MRSISIWISIPTSYPSLSIMWNVFPFHFLLRFAETCVRILILHNRARNASATDVKWRQQIKIVAIIFMTDIILQLTNLSSTRAINNQIELYVFTMSGHDLIRDEVPASQSRRFIARANLLQAATAFLLREPRGRTLHHWPTFLHIYGDRPLREIYLRLIWPTLSLHCFSFSTSTFFCVSAFRQRGEMFLLPVVRDHQSFARKS